MVDVYDVAVVGAGVEGSAVAYYLTQKAKVKNVLLLEQFSRLHPRGSSNGHSRITRRAYHQAFYVKMMDEVYRMWSDLEQESNTKLYEKTGMLIFGPKDSEQLMTYTKGLTEQGIPHENLEYEEAQARYSDQLHLTSDMGVIYDGDGGILNARKAVAAFQNLFVEGGGVFLDEHPVTEIIPGEVVTVVTPHATFKTNKLVITAGGWTQDWMKALGVDLPYELKVRRTEHLYWKVETPEHFAKENFSVFVAYSSLDQDTYFYGVPIHEYPGLVKICTHYGDLRHPDSRDSNHTTVGIKKTAAFIKHYFKGVSTVPSVIEPCMYTEAPNRDPIMDVHPVHSNIVIGGGFSGHGFKLSPLVGKILTELALGLPPSYDLTRFKINRLINSST